MYYFYILKSKLNGEVYMGSTNNLKKRVDQHNKGTELSSKRYRPWELIYYEAFLFEDLARQREQKLKQHGNTKRHLFKRIGFKHIINSAGFTLIELVVVMAIIAILAAAGLSSFTSTQKKGRDARRKSDLTQVSRALEFYYNDQGVYPDTSDGQILSCVASDCDTACTWGDDAMCSPTDPATIYMQTLPKDPATNYQYYYVSDGTYYRMYARLENINDTQIITPVESNTDCEFGSGGVACNYGISSSNASP